MARARRRRVAARRARRAKPDVVCVATRDDAFPLRIALLVRHLDADVPLLVTIFDPGIAEQIADTIPNCRVTSLADIVAPSLAGPCIAPDLLAVLRDGERDAFGLDERLEEVELPPQPAAPRCAASSTAVLHPYDRSAALLIYGFAGLVLMLCFELFGAMIVLDQAFADAFYGSTKSLATVGPNTDVDDGPKWFKVAIGCSVILTLLSAACFTGGLINRFVDSSLTGLFGKRAVPRHDHVIVIGLGQVGLRLCMLLRECGVLVVAVDADADAETVGLARRLQIPVVIGRAANPELLRRLSLELGAGVRGGHQRGPRQHRVGDDRALAQPRPARGAAGGRRRRVRGDALAGRGSATSSTCTGSRAAYIAGVALGSDADSVALRDGTRGAAAAGRRARDGAAGGRSLSLILLNR